MKKYVCIFLFLLSVVANAQQIVERRIYYLDCSLSMSGHSVGSKDIWNDVILNLKKAIEEVPSSGTTELVVLRFASQECHCDNMDGFSSRATDKGKEELINYIDRIPKPHPSLGMTNTYHLDPIKDFKRRCNPAVTTYMFLMTDGDDDGWKEDDGTYVKCNKEMEEWPYTEDEVYSFYIMLNDKNLNTQEKKKRNATRLDIISNTKHFWSLNTANVNVNVIKPTSASFFDCRKDSFVDLKFSGNINNLPLKITDADKNKLIVDTYKIIDGHTIRVWFKKLETAEYNDLPSKFKCILKIELNGADSEGVLKTRKNSKDTYNILVENNFAAECGCSPGPNISLETKQCGKWKSSQYVIPFSLFKWLGTYKSNSLGVVRFYESSIFCNKDSTYAADNQFSFVYNNYAIECGAKAELKFKFDDALQGGKVKIYNKGIEVTNDTIVVTRGNVSLFTFWISPEVPLGRYKISLQLLEHNLMFFDDRNIPEDKIVKDWEIGHERILNPFWIWFWRLLILLLILIAIFWLLLKLRAYLAPKFSADSLIEFSNTNEINVDKETNFILINNNPLLGQLVIDFGNQIYTYILKNLFIQKIVVCPASSVSQSQSWLDKKMHGIIIVQQCEFNNPHLKKIVFRPLRHNQVSCEINNVLVDVLQIDATTGNSNKIELSNYNSSNYIHLVRPCRN